MQAGTCPQHAPQMRPNLPPSFPYAVVLPHPGQANGPAPFATFENAVDGAKASIQGGQMSKTYQARNKT